MEPGVKLTAIFPVSAKNLYDSWLNSSAHSAFSSGRADINPRNGSPFSLQNGYIKGTNLILQPFGRIVQRVRSSDFPDGAPDSRLELLFEKHNSSTKLTLIHTQLPSGEEKKYEKFWKENYFKSMRDYFKQRKPVKKI
jgi:activator of HSP90 ATPase